MNLFQIRLPSQKVRYREWEQSQFCLQRVWLFVNIFKTLSGARNLTI